MRDFHDALELGPDLSVLTRPTGIAAYDFEFRRYLKVRSIRDFERAGPALLRVGPIGDYPALVSRLSDLGANLVQSEEEHRRVAELPGWYDVLADLTPKSIWFDQPPSASVVEAELGWPVFIKGERQTNRHRASTSVARSREDFNRICESWQADEILHWQRMVCRKWEDLQPVGVAVGDTVRPSAELRCFFFRQQLVGCGAYWTSEAWRPSDEQLAAALRVAELQPTGSAFRLSQWMSH